MTDQRSGGIAWTDETWNPIRGCSRVSDGCRNCYAETVAARFCGPGEAFEGLARRRAGGLPQWTGEVRVIDKHLCDPLRWRRPRRVFVNSVSDLFHEHLSNEQIAAVFGVMAAAPQHTFQVLTKRAARMRQWFDWIAREMAGMNAGRGSWSAPWICLAHAQRLDGHQALRVDTEAIARRPWPLQNVWLGVSVEDQKAADERIPLLLDTPAAVRWVSAEPLLERVSLADLYVDCDVLKPLVGLRWIGGKRVDGGRRGQKLDWVVVGGESGPRARPFDPAWARAIISDCKAAKVPVFVKQLGRRPEGLDLRDGHGGDPSEWPEDLRVREWPEVRR